MMKFWFLPFLVFAAIFPTVINALICEYGVNSTSNLAIHPSFKPSVNKTCPHVCVRFMCQVGQNGSANGAGCYDDFKRSCKLSVAPKVDKTKPSFSCTPTYCYAFCNDKKDARCASKTFDSRLAAENGAVKSSVAENGKMKSKSVEGSKASNVMHSFKDAIKKQIETYGEKKSKDSAKSGQEKSGEGKKEVKQPEPIISSVAENGKIKSKSVEGSKASNVMHSVKDAIIKKMKTNGENKSKDSAKNGQEKTKSGEVKKEVKQPEQIIYVVHVKSNGSKYGLKFSSMFLVALVILFW